MRRMTTAFFLLLAVGLTSRPTAGQSSDDGLVSIKLVPENAEVSDTLPPSYRFYHEPRSLEVALTLSNLSEATIVVDQEAMQNILRIQIEISADVIPITTEWQPAVRLPGLRGVDSVPSTSSPVLVEAHTGATWTVALTREDGESFTRGRYVLEYETSELQSALRKPDTSPWLGRGPSVATRMAFVVAPPGNSREVSAMHRLAGTEAALREQFAEAAAAYSRALSADPTDVKAKSGLAGAFVMLNRYSEAIALYEQLMPTLSAESMAFVLLSQAYLGIGDEANARRVLLMSGMSNDRVDVKITELRQVISRRR